MDSSQQTPVATKPDVKERWVLVPVDCDDSIAEAIAGPARCCGGIANDIWTAALDAAPVHPISQKPHNVERMRVCAPGYIGPSNLDVVHAGDYDALLALLDDPEYAPKHARRLIAELKAKVAELEVEKKRMDHMEKVWFYQNSDGNLEFMGDERWVRKHPTLREAVDADI